MAQDSVVEVLLLRNRNSVPAALSEAETRMRWQGDNKAMQQRYQHAARLLKEMLNAQR